MRYQPKFFVLACLSFSFSLLVNATAAERSNKLGFSLLKQSASDIKENQALSPISVSTCMNMVQAGAAGETEAMMTASGFFAENTLENHMENGQFVEMVRAKDCENDRAQIFFSNRVWVE